MLAGARKPVHVIVSINAGKILALPIIAHDGDAEIILVLALVQVGGVHSAGLVQSSKQFMHHVQIDAIGIVACCLVFAHAAISDASGFGSLRFMMW